MEGMDKRAMRFSSGRQDPLLVPYFSVPCSCTRRWSSLPLHWVSCAAMSVSVTLKQVQICLLRDCSATGSFAPGTNNMRP